MEILSIRNFTGRNIFSHKPVIQMVVDLGEFTEITTSQLSGFNERLLSFFPGLKKHYCSPGYEGGFIQRLREGTLISHVTEHLALELQCMNGYDVHFGKTRTVKEPSTFSIVYEYINEHCAADFGYAAAKIVLALVKNETAAINKTLDQLSINIQLLDLGPSTKAIFDEAKKRHIPIRRVGEDSLLQLGYGKHMRFMEASLPDTTSCIAVDLAKNKQLAKFLLHEHSIPVPEGGIIDSEDAAVVLANQIGYPIVTKPLDGNQGKGVTTNICDENLLRSAYRLACKYAKQVIVEKYIKGKDYRVLVVGDQVAATAVRKPPFIIGDGIHSIYELVAEENKNPNRGIGHEKALTRIYLDAVAQDFLARSGFSAQDIPKPGQIIYLRENGNLSTGGSSEDCTIDIHPLNKDLAIKAAKIIGLEVAGIDIVTEDIKNSIITENGAIIEVNAAPGLRMHLFPKEGQGRNVAADILDYIYPSKTPSSIPIISITGTNGKTTVTRMITHILSMTGKMVGMTCSSGSYINGVCISKGDNTGPASAHSILYNKDVEVAVLETARGGIVRKGLGYDLADVGVIVNISEDHLEQDGINTLNDLAFIKALVVEAVKTSGYAVLNADDEMTEYIIPKIGSNIVLFSQYKNNSIIANHIEKNGIAVVVENNLICLYQNKTKLPLIGVSEIPITFNGKAICNIENSLAAVASLLALGITDNIIRLGLRTFMPDPYTNMGRFNLFDMGDFQVLLDYGHNLSGYQSVIQFVNTLNSKRIVGIIGMPGDRMDRAIHEIGKLSGRAFSKLYIKEDKDLRGRAPGEVAGLLYHGAISAGANKENIEIITSETEALNTAIMNSAPGDLIVMFYESFDNSFEIIQKFMEYSTELHNTIIFKDTHVPVINEYIQ